MARRCQITGVGPLTGHNVSHSQRKTNHRWMPNLVTIKVKQGNKTVKLKMTTRALRTLCKYNLNLDKLIEKS